jgi:transposase
MGFTHISEDRKACALSLFDAGRSVSDICCALGVSSRSLSRWIATAAKYDSPVKPKSGLQGRPAILSREVLDSIIAIYSSPETRDAYIDEIRDYLAMEFGIAISISALHRNLVQSGLTRKLLHKIACERNEQAREEWNRLIHSGNFLSDGSQFIFIDETSKNSQNSTRDRGRSLRGVEAHASQPFSRGQRYSIAAALSKEGYIAVHALEDAFNGEEFCAFVVQDVVSHT